MENKKTNTTDVDAKRLPGFLLGLILALSVLYVALEYTSVPSTGDFDMDDMEEFAQDLDFDMLQEPPEPEAPRQQETAPQIKVVERLTGQTERMPDQPSAEVKEADGEADIPALPEPEPQPEDADADQLLPFRVVEQIPQFPGGIDALAKWLTRHLAYPAAAKQQKIQGRVVVSFIIGKDGQVSDAKIEQSVHPLLDREALRVVGLMPRWEPGVDNDKPCRTLFAIPIVFQL